MDTGPKRHRKKLAPIIGGIIGLLVWCWDYDFFLNAGGPATPVSEAILRASHLSGIEYPFQVLVPLLVLVVSGAGIGALIGKINWRPMSRRT
jgi:hypothetical protein